MPAYNAGLYIAEAIESVLRQTYTHWELLIVNDGSTDYTAAVMQMYTRDKRIRSYYQQNKKQGAARNTAIVQSKGEYIAFIDADDIWLPEKLQLQIDVLVNHPQTDLLFCQGYIDDGAQQKDMNINVRPYWTSVDIQEFIAQNQIPILSVIAKKSALAAVGNFDERAAIQNAEDYHLWLRMLINGAIFQSTADRLFIYRVHEKQSTYVNSNLDAPIFAMYYFLFLETEQIVIKEYILQKLKWFIFKPRFKSKYLFLVNRYFILRRLKFMIFFLKVSSILPSFIYNKILFKSVQKI